MRLRLTSRARRNLRQIARSRIQTRSARRAKALLWLHDGQAVAAVAQRLGVSRRAVYNWAEAYQARQVEPTQARVRNRPHPGRPPKKLHRVTERVRYWLKRDPRRWGYASRVWTAPMLLKQVERDLQEKVSLRTVRRALHALGY